MSPPKILGLMVASIVIGGVCIEKVGEVIPKLKRELKNASLELFGYQMSKLFG